MTGAPSADREAYLSLLKGQATGPLRLPMLTGSMSPAILPGDVLVVEPGGGDRVHLGDVAVFYSDNRLTAHRVLFVLRWGRRRWLLEKGDLNATSGWIDDRRILGRVAALDRAGVLLTLPRGKAAAPGVLRERWKLVYYTLLKRRYGK